MGDTHSTQIRPVRLRLRREKGFNLQTLSLQTNGLIAVNVARPSRWGNPYPVGRFGPLDRIAPDQTGAVGLFQAMLDDEELREICAYPTDYDCLKGKNLACWCPEGTDCHADILLKIANSKGPSDAR